MVDNSDIVREPVIAGGASYLDWSSTIGGAVLAAAILFVLSSFGSAIGLGVISPFEYDAFDPTTVGLLAAGWFLLTSAAAFYCGGYIAGRMRGIWGDASASEVETRDALHGAVVWALGVLIFAWVGTVTAATVSSGAVRAADAMAGTIGAVVRSDEVETFADYAVDKLYRSDSIELGEPGSEFRRQSAVILFRAVADGTITEDDKQYLVRLIQRHTSLNETEAEARVDQVYQEVRSAATAFEASASAAAERVQTATVLLGLLIAAGFAIALAAAWFGAVLGGSHRNANTVSWIFVSRR